MSKAKQYAPPTNVQMSLQGSPLSPWTTSQQQSLHEERVSRAIKVGPGSYRVLTPKIPSSMALAVNRILKPTTPSEVSCERQQEAESSLAADIAYFKKSAIGQKRTTKKRVYFPDYPAEEAPSRKNVRIAKGEVGSYVDTAVVSEDKSHPKSSEAIVVDGDTDGQILMEPTIDVDDYEEVPLTEEYEEGSGVHENLRALASPYLVVDGRDVIAGPTFRELKGENTYLKEQLQASVLRVKQLEALLLERNSHVKNLVSENLQLSIKCRKLMKALGEEETREALA